MRRNAVKSFLLIALGLFGIDSATADIINVNGGGDVSGFVYMTFFCGVTTPGCVIPPGIATYTATFDSLSPSACVSSSDPPWGPVCAYTGQSLTATAERLDLNFLGHVYSAGAPHYGASENA